MTFNAVDSCQSQFLFLIWSLLKIKQEAPWVLVVTWNPESWFVFFKFKQYFYHKHSWSECKWQCQKIKAKMKSVYTCMYMYKFSSKRCLKIWHPNPQGPNHYLHDMLVKASYLSHQEYIQCMVYRWGFQTFPR